MTAGFNIAMVNTALTLLQSAIILYAILFAVSEALLVMTSHFKPASIIMSAIVLVIGFGYFADME